MPGLADAHTALDEERVSNLTVADHQFCGFFTEVFTGLDPKLLYSCLRHATYVWNLADG